MKVTVLASLASVALAARGPGFLQVPVHGTVPSSLGSLHAAAPPNRFERRAAGAHEASLHNLFYQYLVDIYVGTPGQHIQIALDTGSSDLWVMASSNPYCTSDPTLINKQGYPNCSEPITFSANSSLTFQNTSDPFMIQYGDYTFANGTYFHDTLNFAGVDLTNATMALADVANSSSTVFGIGITYLEASVEGVADGAAYPIYDNVPVLFKKQGYTAVNAYSLWLNDPNAQSGSILFGGIDHTKYSGTLSLLPVLNLSKHLNHPYSFHVRLDSLSVSGGDIDGTCKLVEGNYPALLDSGTSFVYLPDPLAQSFADSLGYTYHEDEGYFMGSCSPKNAPETFIFNFEGVEIPIPSQEFFMVYDDSDPDVCALLVLPIPIDNPYSSILGDVFLRWVYAVFDLENFQIALAPANHNVQDSDIEVIESTIPSATSAPGYNTAWNTVLTTHAYASCATKVASSSANASSTVAPSSFANSSSLHPGVSTALESTEPGQATTAPVVATESDLPAATSSAFNSAPVVGTESGSAAATSPGSASSPGSGSEGGDVTSTEVVTAYTTYCPEATTFGFNGKIYTVTGATTLTITDCPCTLTHTHTTPSAASAYKKGPATVEGEVSSPGAPVSGSVVVSVEESTTVTIPCSTSAVVAPSAAASVPDNSGPIPDNNSPPVPTPTAPVETSVAISNNVGRATFSVALIFGALLAHL